LLLLPLLVPAPPLLPPPAALPAPPACVAVPPSPAAGGCPGAPPPAGGAGEPGSGLVGWAGADASVEGARVSGVPYPPGSELAGVPTAWLWRAGWPDPSCNTSGTATTAARPTATATAPTATRRCP